MENYVSITRNKSFIYITTWINLQRIVMSEKNPRVKYYTVPFVEIKNNKNGEQINEIKSNGFRQLKKKEKENLNKVFHKIISQDWEKRHQNVTRKDWTRN